LPQAPLSDLKAEAAGLAAQLGSLSTQARAASIAHLGSASRRRSGTGENFWQYRRHMMEDGAERIDWRRSAREEHLFVRETELETARTFLFWVDPSAGFNWSSDAARVHKADRALVISMALAGALSRSGERCGALGGGRSAVSGAKAPARVGEDLRNMRADAAFPPPPRETAAVLIASDFYAPLSVWEPRLRALSGRCRDGALLQVCDPIEEGYPFQGRVKFHRPGEERQRVVGRAETIRTAYLERFETRRREMTDLAAALGWRFVAHSTAEDAAQPLSLLAHGFVNAGALA
jgi:uncharacterized protein (DUF58 family)